MKPIRIVTNGSGVFVDVLKSVDAHANKAEMSFQQHGILIRREKHPTVLVPYTNISYIMVEEDAPTATLPVKKSA